MPWEDTQGNPLDYNQKQCIKSPQTRQKQLEKFLQTRVEGHGRSGCGGGGDPDLRETGTGMWSCLSALFEEILCTVSD